MREAFCLSILYSFIFQINPNLFLLEKMWWALLDSNQGTPKRPDLQSGGFSHSPKDPYIILGAPSRNRTGTAFLPWDFKSHASTCSAKGAYNYWVGLWPSHLGTHRNWCSTVGLLLETPKCYPTTRLWTAVAYNAARPSYPKVCGKIY